MEILKNNLLKVVQDVLIINFFNLFWNLHEASLAFDAAHPRVFVDSFTCLYAQYKALFHFNEIHEHYFSRFFTNFYKFCRIACWQSKGNIIFHRTIMLSSVLPVFRPHNKLQRSVDSFESQPEKTSELVFCWIFLDWDSLKTLKRKL